MTKTKSYYKKLASVAAEIGAEVRQSLCAPAAALGLLMAAVFLQSGPVFAQDADSVKAGLRVWRVAGCGGCHGTFGEGGEGGQEIAGPSLRETMLVRDEMVETVRCGRGPMPAHDASAYVEAPCYGMVGEAPPDLKKGRSLSQEEISTVVDYLMARIVGKGEPALEDCVFYYANPDHPACSRFR